MIRPSDLTDRQQHGGVHQPRPFDISEPSERAPVPEPSDDTNTADDYPLQHAEHEQSPEDVDVGS